MKRAAADWMAAVDLGGTSTKIAFLQDDGSFIEKWEIPTINAENGQHIIQNIVSSIDGKLELMGKTRKKLRGIGMGAPGPIEKETGIMHEAVNLGWERDYPVRRMMEAAIGLPAVIDNDANCAALGEMWKGAGSETRNLVCVTLGTGVGGGVIVNGNIVQGAKGAAGEIGHFTVIPKDGFLCNCGKTGCLETVASAKGVVRLAALKQLRYSGPDSAHSYRTAQLSAEAIFNAARDGDSLALSVVDELAFYLGLALANMANLLNPEKIVIGGGVSKAGRILLDPVVTYFEQFAFNPVKVSTKIALATLGNDAGLLGAAWLLKQQMTK